ncbi:MAG: Exodeoxyribonuclease [Planctomycetaceae bacterium]|nr:Exodeoxyribonuclease [Planctomycetaceae bacterium]
MSVKPANLTDQQAAAITMRKVSVSLSAGAGCGKTFVLTRRFLSHLEPGPDVNLSGLVAITFTERAAREMRERIRAACFDRLRGCPSADVAHWLGITREIDSARVSTIHSFCASILRSSAVEAKLDPQFGLLDPQIGTAFLGNAVTEAVHAAVAKQLPAAVDVVHVFGLERTIVHCQTLVRKRFEMQRDHWGQQSPEQLAALWKERFLALAPSLAIGKLRDSNEVSETYSLLKQHVTTNAEMLARCGVLKTELERLLDDPQSITQPVDWLRQVRENAQVQGGGGKKAWDSEEIYDAVKDRLADLRKVVDKVAPQLEFVEDDVVPAAKLSLQMLELVALAIDQYELRKSESAVLDFDDLVLRSRDLLKQNAAVRQRVAAGIEFLLVDEFQDTDPVQADIVRFLCGAKLTQGKLFLVGDAQQSIYRFRRADPNVFRQLRLEIPEAGRLPLNRNFRSQPAILDFVNALFAGTLGDIFQPLVPAVAQLTPAPSIEFLFAVSNTPDPTSTAESRRQEEAAWMARRIRELLDDPTPRIRDKHPETGATILRPIKAKDIVILFRALSDVRHYEQALRDCRLEYYLVGGRAFYAQQEVFDLLNLLRSLNEPDDEISLLGVLRSPFFGLTDDTLMSIIRHAQSLEQGLLQPPLAELTEGQRSLVLHAQKVLTDLRAVKDRLSLAGLITRALDLTAYDASLVPEFLGRRKLANLRKLIEMARQFDRAGGFTLSDFVERLKGAVAEETDEELAATQAESNNVIRLMTIHQSKGLEFPVVIVADMDRNSQPPPSPVEFSAELGPLIAPPEKFGRQQENVGLRLHRLLESEADAAEHLRLLYVALTRAADYLILSSSLKALDKVSSGWMKLQVSRFDLRTGLPAIDPVTDRPLIPEPFATSCPAVRVHLVPPRSPLLPPAIHETLALANFRESVEQAEPLPLPPLLEPVAIDITQQRSFSVSRLEELDQILRSGQSSPAIQHTTKVDESERGPVPGAEDLGTLVHGVLERLDPQGVKDQIPKLIDACWTSTFAPLPADVRKSATEMLNAFWTSPLAEELRQARLCYRELEFNIVIPRDLLPGEPRCIAGKIDCLLQTSAGDWVIYDYKTGDRFAIGNSAEFLQHYEFQLGVYAWAVQAGLGISPTKVALVTFKPGITITAWPVSELAVRGIQERAAAAVANVIDS